MIFDGGIANPSESPRGNPPALHRKTLASARPKVPELTGQGITVMAFYTTGTTHVVKLFSEELLQFLQEILGYLTGRIGCDTIKLLFTMTFLSERSTYSCV